MLHISDSNPDHLYATSKRKISEQCQGAKHKIDSYLKDIRRTVDACKDDKDNLKTLLKVEEVLRVSMVLLRDTEFTPSRQRSHR